VGRSGGFASHVKAQQDWLIPIPDSLDPALAGPLFCGGITVFAPLIDEAVSPTAHVAVIGIGGLGHLALQFARAWGCQVTAITTSPAKAEEARGFGAHDIQLLGDLAATPNRYDLIINTTNHALEWDAVVNALAPKGPVHRQPYLLTCQPAEDDGVLRAARHPAPGGKPADARDQHRHRPAAQR
jgi:alcohol/geraniol dehydrogenase (NADP+)